MTATQQIESAITAERERLQTAIKHYVEAVPPHSILHKLLWQQANLLARIDALSTLVERSSSKEYHVLLLVMLRRHSKALADAAGIVIADNGAAIQKPIGAGT